MYTGPRPKSKKTINLTKMRNQRNRELPQFEAIYVDRDVLLDLPEEVVKTIQHDFAEAFARRMRLRHFWTKKRFRVELFQEYDIDFNRYRIVAQERFYPPRRMTWQPADPSTSRPSSVRVVTRRSTASSPTRTTADSSTSTSSGPTPSTSPSGRRTDHGR